MSKKRYYKKPAKQVDIAKKRIAFLFSMARRVAIGYKIKSPQ